jgi:hypothetical protein
MPVSHRRLLVRPFSDGPGVDDEDAMGTYNSQSPARRTRCRTALKIVRHRQTWHNVVGTDIGLDVYNLALNRIREQARIDSTS